MKTSFPEKLLHYIWLHALFDQKNLRTTKEATIRILKRGELNTDSGPDFFNAHLKIGARLWVGNVEMHLQSKDWFNHKHHLDEAYSNVILHVVYEEKTPIELEGIPCLNLYPRVNSNLLQKYSSLMNSKLWIPCEDQISSNFNSSFELWKHRLLCERLERKSKDVLSLVSQLNFDWEEAFMQLLFQQMGFKTNRLPMEWLSRKLRFSHFKREAGNLEYIEAMLFGAAGMLRGKEDDKQIKLKYDFELLRRKFKLTSIDESSWKWSRMRPSNFPSIRLAQLAALLASDRNLVHSLLQASELDEMRKLLEVNAGSYWSQHYRFGQRSNEHSTHLGKSSIDLILINLFLPFRFCFQEHHGMDTAELIEFYFEIQKESNSTLKKWRSLGMISRSAADSQALLELKASYCNQQKCLSCQLGAEILKND